MATFTATLPDGANVTKRSGRTLTTLIAAKSPAGDWFAARWSCTPAAAGKAIETIWPSYQKRLITVSAA